MKTAAVHLRNQRYVTRCVTPFYQNTETARDCLNDSEGITLFSSVAGCSTGYELKLIRTWICSNFKERT